MARKALALGLLCALVFAGVNLNGSADAQVVADCSDGEGNVWGQVRGEIANKLIPDWIDHPWGPESPGDLWARCADPYLGPLGDPEGSGSIWGDPHIVTQDGAKFDFQAAGDFVLLRSEDLDIEVQARYTRGGSVTFFDGVAIRSGDTIVAVEDYRGGTPDISINGAGIDLGQLGWTTFEGGILNQIDKEVIIQFDDGLALRADSWQLNLVTPADWAGSFEGIQGNGDGDPTNDLVTGDGTLVDPIDFDLLYGDYLDSWLVDPGDSLFAVPFDEEEDGPIRPGELVTLSDLPADEVEDAAEICTEAGHIRGRGYEECVFDVAYMDDPVWATINPGGALAGAVPALSFHPDIDIVVELPDGAAVGPGLPVAGAGIIGARYEADDYRIPASDDEQRFLRSIAPCSDLPGPVAVIIIGGTPQDTLGLECGAVHPLPEEAFDLRVIDPTGGTGEYGFSIGPAEVVDLGDAVEGQRYTGQLVLGQRAQLSLNLGDSNVFIESGNDASCGLRLVLQDDSGAAAPEQGACFDMGPVALDGPATLELVADGSSTYDFTVSAFSGNTTTPGVLDKELTLSVDAPGQVVSATFDLDADDRIFVETLDSIAGGFTLIDPDGVEVARWPQFLDSGVIEASRTGLYTMTFDAIEALTGDVSLIAHTVADDLTISGSVGEELTLPVATPGQRVSVTLRLKAGDRLNFEILESPAGEFILVDPYGVELANWRHFLDPDVLTIAKTGVHTVTFIPLAESFGIVRVIVEPTEG